LGRVSEEGAAKLHHRSKAKEKGHSKSGDLGSKFHYELGKGTVNSEKKEHEPLKKTGRKFYLMRENNGSFKHRGKKDIRGSGLLYHKRTYWGAIKTSEKRS